MSTTPRNYNVKVHFKSRNDKDRRYLTTQKLASVINSAIRSEQY